MRKNVVNLAGVLFVLLAALVIFGRPVKAADMDVTIDTDYTFTVDPSSRMEIHNAHRGNGSVDMYKVTFTLVDSSNKDLSAGYFIDRNGTSLGWGGHVDADSPESIEFIPYMVLVNADFIVDAFDSSDNPSTPPVNLKLRLDPVYDISYADIKLSQTSYTYDGKAKKPNVTVSFNGKTLQEDEDYFLSYHNNVNAGTAYVNIIGLGDFDCSETVEYSIRKKANTMSVAVKNLKIKYAKVKKKAQSFNCSKFLTVKNAKGSVSYKIQGVAKNKFKKYFKIDAKSGKLTVKKGLKKGTYKVTVKVTAAGNTNFASISKSVTCKVVVK